MEFFRWVLILTGVVLLGVAYLMGRKKVKTDVYHRATPDAYDPSLDELSVPISEPVTLADSAETDWQGGEPNDDSAQYASQYDSHDNRRANEPFLTDEEIDAALPSSDSYKVESVQAELDISDEFDLGHEEDGKFGVTGTGTTSFASAVKNSAYAVDDQDQGARNFSEEFETYQEEPVELDEFEEKLVSVHVVAQRDRRFYGSNLKALFEQHGYKFGRMSLYHCTLDGDKVFSIANMVKPGTFDKAGFDKFETPGITLFMRLPIELDADVAFDFLIREASGLAEELNGQLRDANRNPLSEQTIQHMREDIQQYVFRNKRVLHTS